MEEKFVSKRRAENSIVSDLADQNLLLTGDITITTILAFALTRNLSPKLLLIMYRQAGLIERDLSDTENDRYPDIFRSQL
ncbi:MAG: hypothetical protein WCG44_03465 [bacterium]